MLGREQLLSAAELRAVLNLSDFNIDNGIMKAETNINANNLIKKLGGTIKIGQEIANGISAEKLMGVISAELKKVEGKINFGISIYGDTDKFLRLKLAKEIGIKTKKLLKQENYSIRYVENKDAILSSVTVEKNGLIRRGREFMLEINGGKFSAAITLAVQPFEEFGARDFGRPGRDDVSGMLPPKLAMMMINLSQCSIKKKLLDPFCGSGTIISEAVLMGYKNLIGSDLSDKAIADTKLNTEWVAKNFGVDLSDFNINIFQSGIDKINSKIKPQSIDAIVTEPYLGKPLRGGESKDELRKQGEELKSLYTEAFKNFYKIIKPQGKIIFIIPRFRFQNDWIIISVRKEIIKIGFTPENVFEDKEFLLYSRPEQRVGREVWKFVKN